MEFNIDLDDLKEIEQNYDKLSQFLTSNFCSFPACAFVLQTIIDKVNSIKKVLEEDNGERK